jgi:hypothetical protein
MPLPPTFKIQRPALPAILQEAAQHQDKVNQAYAARDKFEKANKPELIRAEITLRTEKLRINLPTLEAAGLFIWCRNSKVCETSTPCRNLQCKYKTSPDDVVQGCGQCAQFVVCQGNTPGGSWGSVKFMPRQIFDSNLDPIPPP